MFDLPGICCVRVSSNPASAISRICGLCTYADEERFYSYRRSVHRAEPDYGRHVNAIVLRG